MLVSLVSWLSFLSFLFAFCLQILFDLEEFATAVGINDRIIDALRKHFTEGTTVDEFIHERMER